MFQFVFICLYIAAFVVSWRRSVVLFCRVILSCARCAVSVGVHVCGIGSISPRPLCLFRTGRVFDRTAARGPNEYNWFINPLIVFNGDRVSFTKTYVKKKTLAAKKKEEAKKRQLSLGFDEQQPSIE